MKKILLDYDFNDDQLTYSQAIKVVSSSYEDNVYSIYGKKEFTPAFVGYSDNIKTIDSSTISFEELIKNHDGIILEDITKHSYNNQLLFFKSFDKRICVFVAFKNDFNDFIKLNEKLKADFKIFSKQNYLIDTFKDNIYFKGSINLENFLIDDTNLIVTTSDYIASFLDSLKAVSNYFLNRAEKKNSNSFFARLSKNFSMNTNDNHEVQTLYKDILYPFHMTINNDKLFLEIKKDVDVNYKIRAFNILINLLNDKFVLND